MPFELICEVEPPTRPAGQQILTPFFRDLALRLERDLS
jgi:hypothetical protein